MCRINHLNKIVYYKKLIDKISGTLNRPTTNYLDVLNIFTLKSIQISKKWLIWRIITVKFLTIFLAIFR